MQGEDDLDFKIEMESPRATEENNVKSMGSTKKQNSKSALVGGEGGKTGYYPKFLQESAHPGFCILHLSFKVLALVSFLVMGMILDDKTFCFIFVVSLCAIDFWVVKNLTGR